MDEVLVYCIVVGSDVMLVFSCFEFCGLMQFYGLSYGVLFLVYCVGGLVDMVVDLMFEDFVVGIVIGFVFDVFNVDVYCCVLCCVFVLWSWFEFWVWVCLLVMWQCFVWSDVVCCYVDFYDCVM